VPVARASIKPRKTTRSAGKTTAKSDDSSRKPTEKKHTKPEKKAEKLVQEPEQITEGGGFYTAAELAEILGISKAYFDAQIRPKIRLSDERKEGRTVYLRASSAVSIWVKMQVAKEVAAAAPAMSFESDEGFAFGTSPALEKYREERAKLARLDRLEREKKLVRRDSMKIMLSQIARMLRQTVELLQRDFGNEAAELLRDALKALEVSVASSEIEELAVDEIE
jgi:hypothetical protein